MWLAQAFGWRFYADIALYALLLLCVVAFFWIVVDTLRWGISPMPTLGDAQKAMVSTIPPDLQGTVLELGAGWGDLALAIVQRCEGVEVIAYEASWIPYLVGRLRSRLAKGGERICWVRGDFFLQEWPSSVSAVFCYLYPGAMERLAKTLPQRLPAGTRVISHAFALPRWTPESVLSLRGFWVTPIYSYRIPTRHEVILKSGFVGEN